MRGHALPRRAALGIVRAIVLRSPSMRIALSLVVALLLISVARDAAAQGVLVNARIARDASSRSAPRPTRRR
jgi:hypothetical protein